MASGYSPDIGPTISGASRPALLTAVETANASIRSARSAVKTNI